MHALAPSPNALFVCKFSLNMSSPESSKALASQPSPVRPPSVSAAPSPVASQYVSLVLSPKSCVDIFLQYGRLYIILVWLAGASEEEEQPQDREQRQGVRLSEKSSGNTTVETTQG